MSSLIEWCIQKTVRHCLNVRSLRVPLDLRGIGSTDGAGTVSLEETNEEITLREMCTIFNFICSEVVNKSADFRPLNMDEVVPFLEADYQNERKFSPTLSHLSTHLAWNS